MSKEPTAEPRIAEATGVATAVDEDIAAAMVAAIKDAIAIGETDPAKIRARMMAARERAERAQARLASGPFFYEKPIRKKPAKDKAKKKARRRR